MKIDLITLQKLIWLIYQKFIDQEKIDLKEIKIELGEVVQLELLLNYRQIKTLIKAKAKIVVKEQIEIITNGTVRYGFLKLDYDKLLQELIKDLPDCYLQDKKIIIKNDYLKSLKIYQDHIELELL